MSYSKCMPNPLDAMHFWGKIWLQSQIWLSGGVPSTTHFEEPVGWGNWNSYRATVWILQMTWRAEWEEPSFLLVNYFLDHYCHHSSQVSSLFLSDLFDFLDYKEGKYAIARYTSITVWFMPIRNAVGHKSEILFVLIFWVCSWETETTQCLELKQQF